MDGTSGRSTSSAPHIPRPSAWSAGQRLLIDVAAGTVANALNETGIEYILLKGPSHALWLYPDRGARPYSDCDFYVNPTRLSAARRVLSSLGFVSEGWEPLKGDATPASREWRRDDGVTVDLHRTLVGVEADPERAWRSLTSNTEEIDLRGASIRIFGLHARALHVVLHVSQHGSIHGHPLKDLRLALDKLTMDDWRQVAELAREVEATAAFSAGLRMLPEGRAVAASLDINRVSTTNTELRARNAPPAAYNIEHFIQTKGFFARCALVFRKLFPPVDFIKTRIPIANRGRWGLVIAYVLRPFSVLGQLGPGLISWRAARREARRTEERPDSAPRR